MSNAVAKKRIARYYRRLSYPFVSSESFLRKVYRKAKGEDPNLQNPENFSEKLLYLMLHYRNPLETICADKYYVKEYLDACGYGDLMKPLLGVYSSVDDIDFDSLPDEFFMKVNHVSGNNMVIKGRKDEDIKKAQEFFKEVLKINYYYVDREYQYKDIRPLLLCEQCLRDKNGQMPIDYKFYCFSGVPKYYMVSCGEFEHKVRNHKFDMTGQSVDHYFKKTPTLSYDEAIALIPENIDEMIKIVEKLCKPFPHVRVDLYNVDGRIYFGELTFYSNGGVVNVYDKEFDKTIGSWIDLDQYKEDMI